LSSFLSSASCPWAIPIPNPNTSRSATSQAQPGQPRDSALIMVSFPYIAGMSAACLPGVVSGKFGRHTSSDYKPEQPGEKALSPFFIFAGTGHPHGAYNNAFQLRQSLSTTHNHNNDRQRMSR